MDQDRNHGKKCSVFKRIKYFLTRQVRMDARLLDFMQEHPEIAPDSDPLEAPPDEFQKILDEMEKRGYKVSAEWRHLKKLIGNLNTFKMVSLLSRLMAK